MGQKVAVFIDNSNVFRNLHELRKTDPLWICFYDPHSLALSLTGSRDLVYVGFYCARPPAYLLSEGELGIRKHTYSTRYYNTIEKLPMLNVKYADLKGEKGSMVEKNLDTQIATDMVTMAALGKYDVAILVSNDGDYVSAVENTKNFFGKKVELVYFRGHLSMSLKKVCNISRRARRIMFKGLIFDRVIDKTSR